MSEAAETRAESCQIHPGFSYTHFCRLDTCMTPLCSRCIKLHTEFHKASGSFIELETIEDVKELALDKLEAIYQVYAKDLEHIKQIEEFVQAEYAEHCSSQLASVRKIKTDLIEAIYRYFDGLEQQLEDQGSLGQQVAQVQFCEQKYTDKLTELEQELTSFQDPASLLKSLAYYLRYNYDQEYLSLKSQLDYTKQQLNSLISIEVVPDQQYLSKIELLLQQLCSPQPVALSLYQD